MRCKYCQCYKVVKNGKVNGKQLYWCKGCKHQYIDNGNFVGMRTKTDVITTALNLYYEGLEDGIRARETNQIVERKHGTLKDRLRPARGLKHDETAKIWLDRYIANYYFVKPHLSLEGRTPAQAAGLDIKPSWGELIQKAIMSTTNQDIREDLIKATTR